MHRYPEMMIAPMRREIAELGAVDLKSPEAVEEFIAHSKGGTAMIVVNSVCGCSAGTMRPGLALALEQGPKPGAIGQVFAGADLEATERARELFAPYPPSSPAIALFKDGELVFMLERHQIQGRSPEAIASSLSGAVASHSAAA
ncbi:MAG TPA: BrxA/BrxB family bacilliredoxin [Longimicrobiales bacterium]|nr:BrxA/BrxB family bacilliredoxin [Longimicrobiales bacterium]